MMSGDWGAQEGLGNRVCIGSVWLIPPGGVWTRMKALSVTTILGGGAGSWWAGMPRTLPGPMGLLWEE